MVAQGKYGGQGKFRRGWLVLKGLPFHLWDEVQLNFILKKWGRVTKVAKETLKLVDLTRAKLWVEMLPNVVLPALLEVEDGEWSYTVAVSVAGEDEDADAVTSELNQQERVGESGRLRLSVVKSCRRATRCSSSPPVCIGFVPFSQRAASSTKAIVTLCPDDARAGAEVFFGEEGRAVELRPSPCSTLGHCQTTPWASGREEKKSKRGRGKPRVHMRDATQEEETAISKKTWSTLFPPSADRRQGHRCCSEPIFTRGSSSSSEDRNMEEEFGWALRWSEVQSESSLQMSLSGNLSKEDTSASRVELKGGLTGRVGFDPRGYSVMGSPSN
ncbi:hypothetical protein CK203_071802 [Vitis vinifera]|uniref:DUF4283 domain-containing protein n=1 Tax=Vitis vinifera TaxID=29760 RepID=A0A438C339_VITVI|nr:hypothetical protein CK203_071802 [Vitis vinifera]